jgi:competence protein ComEA
MRMTRILIVVAALGLAAFALWHPAPAPLAVTAHPSPRAAGRGGRVKSGHAFQSSGAADSEAVVFVAGAVARPGLYRVRGGDRVGDAIRLAGGPSAAADPWAVNLAARVRDGDEIYVPRAGERPLAPATRGRRSRATPEPARDVDVNTADAQTLGRVPGIGRAIAARIVDLRERDGPYASLDELLDAAGMTSGRLERARPFLRPP